MAKRIIAGGESYRVLLASALLLSIPVINSCAQHPSNQRSPADSDASKTKLPSSAKIQLNAREMGTTSDPSLLKNTLTDLFKKRETEGVYKKGSFDVEKTVFIRAERSLKVGEVIKVLQAVKEAGASPAQLAIEVDSDKAGDFQPGPLMLVVTVGDPGSNSMKVISGGIELFLPEFTLKRSEKDTVPKAFVVVEIPKEGEYVIDGEPNPKSALKDELLVRLKEKTDKRVVVLVEKDSEISYGSLADAAYAAFEAHADMFQVTMLVA